MNDLHPDEIRATCVDGAQLYSCRPDRLISEDNQKLSEADLQALQVTWIAISSARCSSSLYPAAGAVPCSK